MEPKQELDSPAIEGIDNRQIWKTVVCAMLPVLTACTYHQSAGFASSRPNHETTAVGQVRGVVATNEAVAIDQDNRCAFDRAALSFAGSASAQARCLLRPVLRYANLAEPAPRLPEPLASLIGRLVSIETSSLRQYLDANGIEEEDIGGSLESPLSRSRNNRPEAPLAQYFVIHDTSTPVLEIDQPFPEDINSAGWRHNRLDRWMEGSPRAHVFVSRVGDSISPVGFGTPWRATKFEVQVLGNEGKGLFLHVELVQPRRKDQNGIDAFSPDPGFSKAQLDRLALLYLAASVRRGEWLIPVFHAVLDTGISGGHDDPQNFDISEWADSLRILIESI